MTEPPDWAIQVPNAPIHQVPAETSGAFKFPQAQNLCASLIGGNPLMSSLLELGGGGPGASGVAGGLQIFADLLCGFASGQQNYSGTTADTVLGGADAANTQFYDNPFLSGVLDLGGGPDNSTGVAGGLFGGTQSFANALCGLGTGSEVGDTTPQSVIDQSQGMMNTVNGHPFASGLIDLGGGADGTGALGMANSGLVGGQSFADQLCGWATGDMNTTGTTPQGVLGGVADFCEALASTFIGSLMTAGTGVMGLINGIQSFTDQLCGYGTGNPTQTGTTAQTILGGIDTFQTAALGDSLATHILSLSDNTGNLAVDVLTGTSTYGPLGLKSPLTAANLAGQISPNVVGVAPAGTITDTTPNLIINNLFRGTNPIGNPINGWSHDIATGYIGLGAAKMEAPTLDELVGNQIPVTAGQNMNVSVHTKWSGLSYSGTDPIVLGISEYRYDPLIGASVETSTSLVSTVTSPGASSDWTQLSGSYTVPAGIDEIRMRLSAPDATAGTLWFDNGNVTKTDLVGDHIVPGIGVTVDNITTRLLGWDGSGFSHVQSATALGTQSQSTRSNTMSISDLWAVYNNLTAETPGITARDDFSRTSSTSLGADWTEIYGSGNGHWATDTDHAYWVKINPYGNRESMCLYIKSGENISTTDYQTISVLLSSAAESDWTGTGYNDVIGRYKDTSNYVRFRVAGSGYYSQLNAWELVKYVAGTPTTIASGNTTGIGSGTALTLICGDTGSSTIRNFTVKVGSTVLSQVTDSSSVYGADARGWGMGALAGGVLFGTSLLPGNVDLFIAQDTP